MGIHKLDLFPLEVINVSLNLQVKVVPTLNHSHSPVVSRGPVWSPQHTVLLLALSVWRPNEH